MIIKNNLLLFIIILFTTSNLLASILNINGLSKLTLSDIQTQTSINLNKNSYTEDEINMLVKDLYQSDLIFDLSYSKVGNTHNLNLQENKLIENIFINGNKRVEDELILQNISMKINGFINKNNIKDDIRTIKNIYRFKGFNNANIEISTEVFSDDRVNLIYEIRENNQSQIERIKFIGNTTFSDRYLLSLINTKAKNFYNIFSSGSNLNLDNFNFDINKVKYFYKQKGFLDVDVNFSISESSSDKFTVIFFVDEGERLKLDDIKIETNQSNISELINKNFDKYLNKFSKNNFYYDQIIVDEFLDRINGLLIKSNTFNTIYVSKLEQNPQTNRLIFIEQKIRPTRINKINIIGNEITKDTTIRSKLQFEPGDYFNKNILNLTKKELLKYKYMSKIKCGYYFYNYACRPVKKKDFFCIC